MRVLWLLGTMALLLAGCGEDNEPTRSNEFVPLTAIRIEAPYPNLILAKGTVGQFEAFGNYSGLFESKITDRVVWESLNADVLMFENATRPGWGQAGAPNAVEVRATMNGVEGKLNFTVSDEQIESLALVPSPANLTVGEVKKFIATGTFSQGAVQDVTEQVQWAVSDPAIATIDAATGLAKALAVGDAVVTADFPNSQVAEEILLTVNPSISVSSSISMLTLNETVQLTATRTSSSDLQEDITTVVTWVSDNPAIATVSSSGVVTGVAPGTTGIQAKLGSVSGSVVLRVATLNSIKVSPKNKNEVLLTNDSMQLMATATFDGGATRDVTAQAEWSSNSSLITMSNTKGLVVSGNSPGNAEVKALWNDKMGVISLDIVTP